MSNPNFAPNIRTPADLKGAQELKRSLEETILQTKALGDNATALEARLQSVNAALTGQSASAVRAAAALRDTITSTKALGGDSKALEQQLKALRAAHHLPAAGLFGKAAGMAKEALGGVPGMGGLSKMLSGAAGPVALLPNAFQAARKSIDEFAKSEDAVTGLDTALAQTGQLNDPFREKLQARATELQHLTAIADEEWLPVMQRLIQSGADNTNIDQYTEAVKNLAGLMGGDIQAATGVFTEAMQGSFGSLSRFGIQVQEGGTQTERLNSVMEQLAQHGGGLLEARAKTLSGQWQLLKANTADLFTAFGRGIAKTGALQAVCYGLSESAAWLAEKLGGVIPKVEDLTNTQAKTVQTSQNAAHAATDHATALDKVKEASDKARQSLDQQRAAAEQLAAFEEKKADLEMGLELEQLKARKDLSPAQKQVEEQRIRAAAEQRKAERPITAARDEISRQRETMRQATNARVLAGSDVAWQGLRAGEAKNVEARQHATGQIAVLEDEIAKQEARLAAMNPSQGGFGGQLEVHRQREELQIDIDYKRRQLDKAKTARDAIPLHTIAGLGTAKEEGDKLKKLAEAAETAHKTEAAIKESTDAVIKQKTAELAWLGHFRDLQGQKSTEEAHNKFRDQITKGQEKLQSSRTKIEGKKTSAEDRDAYNKSLREQVDNILAAVSGGLAPGEAQGAFRDVMAKFGGSPEEKQAFQADVNRRYFEALRKRRPVVPPPSVPAEPPPKPPGFDIRATGGSGPRKDSAPASLDPKGLPPAPATQPAHEPVAPAPQPAPAPQAAVPPVKPIVLGTSDVQHQLDGMVGEANRQLAQFTAGTLDLIQVQQRQLAETNRKIDTLRSQMANNRPA